MSIENTTPDGKATTVGDFRPFDRLLERVEHIDRVVSRLDRLAAEAPPLLATLVDSLDEYAAKLGSQGIDIETSLRQGVHALLWLGQRVSEPELERLGILLRSEVLEPHALAVVGKTGNALATCHERTCSAENPEQLGPFGLLRALGDPDVRRSLGFLVAVARGFGKTVGDPHGR